MRTRLLEGNATVKRNSITRKRHGGYLESPFVRITPTGGCQLTLFLSLNSYRCVARWQEKSRSPYRSRMAAIILQDLVRSGFNRECDVCNTGAGSSSQRRHESRTACLLDFITCIREHFIGCIGFIKATVLLII
ncbi:hypothetical protein GWI33_014914 [Rhynchophorus ferrugineus]|uniref:Uncharacterized protein n=1 Tax=Rhynchophorus ferrugineus TaxID=354439 RepID=A0A834I645_RHYFE|nr:hypothetical protein GWI33_014914 [Rhynchophorus ferrugineus]